MKTVLNIFLISLVSISILGIELNVNDMIRGDLDIEMMDLHEEGSGEKDGQENTSENDELSDYCLYSTRMGKMESTDLSTTDHARLLILVTPHRDILLPPPEQL